jgi:POT family proton-dependent oligopeptide transporter
MALWIDRASIAWPKLHAIPATWFQSLNPLFVFTLTPLVVAYWSRNKSQHGYTPIALRRMALGAFGVALSYAMLCGIIATAGANLVHWGIVIAFFVLYTLGELYILPVGLSLFATLSPSRFSATAIAAWFLAGFVGNFLGGYVGTWWSKLSPAEFFGATAAIAAISGVALAALALQGGARPRSA